MNGRSFAGAVVAFVALPGTVAFLVPLLLFASRRGIGSFEWLALIPLTLGTLLLSWCVREFYVVGQGTLAPWAPPRNLVTSGPFRLSRNPIYVAVGLILGGWAIGFHSRPLAIYAGAVMVAFHIRVVAGEEPWLARTHGGEWVRYRRRVPRWLPWRLSVLGKQRQTRDRLQIDDLP